MQNSSKKNQDEGLRKKALMEARIMQANLPNLFYSYDSDARSPLEVAASMGDIEIAKIMLALGNDKSSIFKNNPYAMVHLLSNKAGGSYNMLDMLFPEDEEEQYSFLDHSEIFDPFNAKSHGVLDSPALTFDVIKAFDIYKKHHARIEVSDHEIARFEHYEQKINAIIINSLEVASQVTREIKSPGDILMSQTYFARCPDHVQHQLQEIYHLLGEDEFSQKIIKVIEKNLAKLAGYVVVLGEIDIPVKAGYIGDFRSYVAVPDGSLKDNIIHELMHHMIDLLFANPSLAPYKEGDVAAEKIFDKATQQVINNIVKNLGLDVELCSDAKMVYQCGSDLYENLLKQTANSDFNHAAKQFLMPFSNYYQESELPAEIIAYWAEARLDKDNVEFTHLLQPITDYYSDYIEPQMDIYLQGEIQIN